MSIFIYLFIFFADGVGLNKHLYYPTQQNAFSRLTEECKVLLLSVTKQLQFPRGSKCPKASETYPDLTRWNSLFFCFLKSHLFQRTMVPATLSKLALSSIRDLRPLGWKIPLSSSTLRPVTKACYSWWWQIKLQFYNTKGRTLPTVLAPPGVILRQAVHNLPQTGSFPLSKSKSYCVMVKCLFLCGVQEKKNAKKWDFCRWRLSLLFLIFKWVLRNRCQQRREDTVPLCWKTEECRQSRNLTIRIFDEKLYDPENFSHTDFAAWWLVFFLVYQYGPIRFTSLESMTPRLFLELLCL